MQAEIGTDIAKATSLLKAGELVGMPTETVYGLAGNALNPKAVAKIFAVKERPSFDPLIMHLPNIEAVLKYVKDVPQLALDLAERYWPGPLTMVFKRQDIVPDLVTSGLDTVAIRVPNHPLAQELLQQLDFPLAAPSANPFGYVSPTTPQHVVRQLGQKIDYVLDGGACQIGLESTIVSFAGDVPELLRKGGLPLEDIEVELGNNLKVRTHGSSNPAAPGMLAQHYSPNARFELVSNQSLAYWQKRLDVASPDQAFLLFGVSTLSNDPRVIDLSSQSDLTEAATRLFASMRLLDEQGYKYITAMELPEEGLGRAINDRLRRAAAKFSDNIE